MTREEYKDELRAGVTNYALTVKQAIDAAYKHADETNPNGWHSASELPPLDEDGDSECVIGIWEEQQVSPFITIPLPVVGYVSYEDGEWTKPIKWWIAPPKEE